MAERKKKLPNRHVFSDDELDTPPQAQVLERVKSDRMIASTSIDEDRRRRTIIVEKKNGSYGFTLQSYGIHYQKEQEVEMITYVDHVEYDGPAFKAGMRQGDVILSINGTDMENADHKTLVNYIKGCENRMRMVVLFENCVRKVELHMRYLHLQEILKNKMAELEGVVLKEKEIIEGKWKTHSLPARKKATDNANDSQISPSDNESTLPYTRPLSTEDLSKKQQNPIIPPPAQFILAYQYLDPYHKHMFKSSTPSSSGEYLVSNTSLRSQNNFIMSSNENNSYSSLSNQSPSQRSQQQQQQSQHHHHHHHVPENSADYGNVQQQNKEKSTKSRRHCHVGHSTYSCNPCMGHFISKRDKSADKDNTSLDAYDLASPCCEANCVPVKRRTRHKEHHHKHKHRDKDRPPPRPRSQSHASPQIQTAHVHTYEGGKKHDHHSNHYDLSSQMASHCSLHSCNSNELCQRTAVENPGYTSSLSTDTLLWDVKKNEQVCNRQGFKQRPTSVYHPQTTTSTHSYVHRYVHPSQVQPIQSTITTTHAYIPPQYNAKQKSWDDLAKSGGGGGSFVDSGYSSYHQVPANKGQVQAANRQVIPRRSSQTPYRYSAFANVENYVPAPQAFVQAETITKTTIITTKSTENLISNAQYNLSDDSCECLVTTQPSPKQQQHIIATNCAACNAGNFHVDQSYQGYYSNLARNTNANRYIPTKTEITRL